MLLQVGERDRGPAREGMVVGDRRDERLVEDDLGRESLWRRVDRGDDREVGLAGQAGGEPLGGCLGQRDPHGRVRAVEAGEQVGQERRRARADDADGSPPRTRPVRSSTARRTAATASSAARAWGSTAAPTSVGANRPRRAVEQGLPQLGLEPAHLGAHPRLCDVEPLGRAREARLLGDRHEVLELSQLHNESC